MLLLILLHNGMVIVDNNRHLLHSVVQKELEYGFVSANLYGSDLVVGPFLLAEYALY